MAKRADPVLELLKDDIDRAPYKFIRFDPPAEFPIGTLAARITGPGMPSKGIPFCVPEEDKENWARRIVFALWIAYQCGRGQLPEDYDASQKEMRRTYD